jgi:hypothetical protein
MIVNLFYLCSHMGLNLKHLSKISIVELSPFKVLKGLLMIESGKVQLP